MAQLKWDDEAVIHGIQVKAIFFDGDAALKEQHIIPRMIPMFVGAPVAPTLICAEAERKNFYFENLVGQPDLAFAHGKGLLCVEYKMNSYRNHSRQRWQQQIRLKDMLQNIICSFVLAHSEKKPTACFLRYHNVAYLLVPPPELIQELRRLAPLGMQYFSDARRVAASELATFAVPRIEKLYPAPESAGSAEGRRAHEVHLRRDEEPVEP